ncbi:hypothetical protein LIER_34577 [Lithospermum erythrorhizon]|uniref:Uncharacterized protein n=1 Tax=Lithospermum erythrorhizon TaxID=34254 RepID=A0AAV3S212_LITER
MICSTGSKLKRYVFTDSQGNEVLAAIYASDIDVLCPMIQLYGVYDISNADVRLTDRKYQIISNQFQWNLRRHTSIRAVPFSRIPDVYKAGFHTADIMGVLIDADEVKEAKNDRDTVQHFTIMNPMKIPFCISVWNEMIPAVGNGLVQAAKNHSVVVAKRLAIKSYRTN